MSCCFSGNHLWVYAFDKHISAGSNTQIEGSGYGYKIYERERLIIVQPFIPVVSGKRPFQSVQDAQCIGNLVLERIKAGNEFAISKADLDNLGVVY